MAQSNHYFHMILRNGTRHIDLTARLHEYDENNNALDNMIQLTVKGPVYGTNTTGEVGIFLTEKEQDELIAGILERRGINSHNTLGIGGYIDKMYFTGTGIEADNEVQSLIHPAKTKQSWQLTQTA